MSCIYLSILSTFSTVSITTISIFIKEIVQYWPMLELRTHIIKVVMLNQFLKSSEGQKEFVFSHFLWIQLVKGREE